MIKCEIHDYVEIAVMYRYQLSLLLVDKSQIQGKAVNLIINPQRHECLVLENNDGLREIMLDSIKNITAVTQNPHFKTVEIN